MNRNKNNLFVKIEPITCLIFLNGYGMKVILLMGPSSVGKSTLCDELVKTHGWKTASLDEASLLINRKTDLIKLKPELEQAVRLSGLANLMSEKEILTLCMQGKLSISQKPHEIVDYQFSSLQLPDLEQVLQGAGFDEVESEKLASNMRRVVENGLDIPVYMLYDDVFSIENEDKTIIIDIFPLPQGVLSVLDDFRERAAKFQEINPAIHLTIHTVLAYCPPQFLSKRILERNRRAEQEGNSGNQRVGLFPFEQLSEVLTAASHQTPSSQPMHSLSKKELFNIVKQHGKMPHTALFIEETVDPSILASPSMSNDKPAETVEIINEDDLSYPLTIETPHIGTAEEIKKYKELHDKLGFSAYKTVMLSIRRREAYDSIIDTSKDSAGSLAAHLVEELDSLVASKINPNLN